MAELRFLAVHGCSIPVLSLWLSGAGISSLWGLSPLHEIIDTFALLFPDYSNLISRVSIPTLGNDNCSGNFKSIFHPRGAKTFLKQRHQGNICFKNLSRRGWLFVHFMFPFNFSSFFSCPCRQSFLCKQLLCDSFSSSLGTL